MKRDNTKRIDQYLSGELSDAEKQKFEAELKSNPELQKELDLQQNVYEGAKRSSVRKTVKSVGKKHHLINLTKWIVGGVAVIALVTSAVYFSTQVDNSSEKENESTNQSQSELKSKELIKDLPREVFTWSGEDTVYLSESGVLISVPNEALLQNGQPYKGKAIIEWQEAVDGATIMKSGLSTMADSNLLETQGMFSFRVQAENGDLLEVDPEVGIYLQVPVDEIKPGMQLYEGEYDKDSVINWVNPVALEKIPVPVDMSELDFYPKGYEDTLDKLKLNQEKEYRDSLYLACEVFEMESNDDQINKEEEITNTSNLAEHRIYDTLIEDTLYEYSKAQEEVSTVDSIQYEKFNSIPPSKVLAFWNKKFNNTILATSDFEKRMREIHETCDESLLKLYTSNLDRPLYFIDSLAVTRGYKQFESFFAERVGKIELDNPHLNKLQKFYERGIKELREQLKLERERKAQQERKWDNEVTTARSEENVRTANRKAQAFQEEASLNHEHVRKQLGFTQNIKITRNTIIVNIDREVYAATRARKTTTVSFNGKKSVIKYSDFTLKIAKHENFERLYVYLLSDKLNSYQRIGHKQGKVDYPLNDRITYDIVVLGINETGYFYHEIKQIKKGTFGEVKLKSISESDFEKRIITLNQNRLGRPMIIKDELAWLKLEKENYKVQRLREEKRKFLERIRKVVFPCYNNNGYKDILIEVFPTVVTE